MGQRKIYHARLMYARPLIDSLEFAANGRQISGEVKVAELSRLQDMLDNLEGVLRYIIRGGVNKQGSHFLNVSVTGTVGLRCQRCLEGLDYSVQLENCLLLCEQATLDAQDAVDDQPDSILAETQLNVVDLLEEEILLSLPIAPKHAACQAKRSENMHAEQAHPFAVLAKLKRS